MELLEFVNSIGGRIVFTGGVGSDNNSIMVHVQKGFSSLRQCRGSLRGSLNGWAKLTKDLDECYHNALDQLAKTMSGLEVSFDADNVVLLAPCLTHTKPKV
jgi:hypothetical protein